MDDDALLDQFYKFPFCPLTPELKDIYEQYPFPEGLDRQYCEQSTREFAFCRMRLDRLVRGLNYEENTFIDTYPLPISAESIDPMAEAWRNPPTAFVERHEVLAGLAVKFENNGTVGWFIGLVETVFIENLKFIDSIYQVNFPVFRFIEGMILLEGQFDDTVIRDLKKYQKFYKESILGKLIPGRPPSDPKEYLEPASAWIRKYPDILESELVRKISCDERTFRTAIKKGHYKSFRDFKNKVLSK